jgi:hypothetical protein
MRLYDEKHRAIEATLVPRGFKYLRKGYREPLLCKDCEGIISRFETYFATAWYEQGKCPNKVRDNVVQVTGLDYTLFRLFHLSVLWRASVSKREEFSGVQLGLHEERIRRMILAGDPGKPNQYPLFVNFLVTPDTREVQQQIIMQPGAIRVEGHRVYLFCFGGCAWYYLVSSHASPSYFSYAPSLDGVLTATVQNWTDFQPVRSFAESYSTPAES